jgi:hypothetical protein
MLGWYGPGEGAGLIGAVIGAIIGSFCLRVLCWPENGLTCDSSAKPTSQYSIEERAESTFLAALLRHPDARGICPLIGEDPPIWPS